LAALAKFQEKLKPAAAPPEEATKLAASAEGDTEALCRLHSLPNWYATAALCVVATDELHVSHANALSRLPPLSCYDAERYAANRAATPLACRKRWTTPAG